MFCIVKCSHWIWSPSLYLCPSPAMCFSHYGVFTLPDSDSYADADTIACIEKVTMDGNGMAPRSVFNGYRTHLSRSRSWSRSSGNTSEHYYRPQRSCGKVMFLHLSVILFTEVGVSGRQPPVKHTAPPRKPLQWTVRILLECILVIKPNSLCLGTGIGLGIGLGQCK